MQGLARALRDGGQGILLQPDGAKDEGAPPASRGSAFDRRNVSRQGVAGTSSRTPARSISLTTEAARRLTPSRIRSIGMFE